jgi:hypothetical protein
VTNEELDVAIEELELRLERLRALYEQYFLGFEKMEPAVARKDVDRRIYVLRREKIRNTGKRFKLQTLIQRFNTFQQYWQRICREIENGTYRRLIQRAERRLGPSEALTIAAQRRFGGRRRVEGASGSAPPPGAGNSSHPPDDPLTLRPAPASTPADSGAGADAGGFSSEETATAAMRRRLAPPPKPVRRPTADATAAPAEPADSAPPVPVRHETVGPKPATPPAPRPKTQRPSAFDSLKLDMDFLGDWDPGSLRPNSPPTKPAVAAPAANPREPREGAAPPRAAPPRPAAQPKPAPPAEKPKSSPRAAPSPRPNTEAERPKPPAPEAFDARVRELHGRLNELKKQNREGSQVSLEGLAKSLKDTESRLREKHGDRRIDFEVVLKDGRAVVKPIVR